MDSSASNRFEQIEALYHRALELPPADRVNQLAEWCGPDMEMFDEVHSLLDAFHEQHTVTVTGIDGEQPKPRSTDRRVGHPLGRYTIERELGRGGMGVVYLASRNEGGIQQTVAIKVLSSLLTTKFHEDHFRQEGQILASLEHPNIAGMIDGGVSEQGEPYLVMEYVEGVRLDEYVAAHPLSVKGLVELILQVCDAVQYAHRNLVVHRDLKPGNILVGNDGRPKLLDFGTAKLMDPADPAGVGRFTKQGFRAFTPEYASPEQILGGVVTAASDVYSLGIICYRLLTGRQPYRFSSYANEQFIQTITNYEPARPSTVLTGVDAARDAVILPFDIHRRRRELRGDLDAIVLKAMAKQPDRRYQSAAELADDLRNYLAARPVSARESNWRYRATKFGERNRAQVISAAAVVIAIVAGLAATVWQAGIARAEQARADAQFQNVRKLNRFLLFDFYNEVELLPGSTGVQKELLTQSLAFLDRLQRESPDDPDVLVDVVESYTKMGDLQGNPYSNNLSDPEPAIATLKKALDLAIGVRRRYPKMDRALLAFGHVEESLGETYFGKGDVAAATPHLESAAAALEEIANRPGASPDTLPDAGAVYGVLGDMYGGSFVGNLEPERAEAYFRKSLALDLRAIERDPNHLRARRGVTICNLKLGTVLQDTRTLEAIALFEAGLSQIRMMSTPGKSNFQNIRLENLLRNHLAYALSLVGRFDEAIEHARQSVRDNEAFFALDPTNQRALIDASTSWYFCANALESRAESKNSAADRAEAKALYLKAAGGLGTVLKTQPDNAIWNSTLTEIMNRLGGLAKTEGKLAEARKYWALARERASAAADREDAMEAVLQKAAFILSLDDATPDLMDLPRALGYAERLNRKTKYSNPDYLVILGRIYRLLAQPSEARAVIAKADSLIPPTKPGEPANDLRKRIDREKTLLGQNTK